MLTVEERTSPGNEQTGDNFKHYLKEIHCEGMDLTIWQTIGFSSGLLRTWK